MLKKHWIKWIFLIIIFLIISILFMKTVTYIMKPQDDSLINVAGFYGERKNSLDMVYVGGSACYRFWAPLEAFEKQGIISYTLGTNSMPAEIYKTMIKEIFKTQKPNLIVLDARAFQWRCDKYINEVTYRCTLTGMPLSYNKIQFISENVNKYIKEDELSYYFDIIKYHRDLKNVTIDDQIKMIFNSYKNPNKGFVLNADVVKQEPMIKYETTEKKELPTETEEILIDLLEYIKTTDCNYLFVVTPYIEKEEEKKLYNYMKDIINNYGYDFLDANDYNSEIQIDSDVDLYDISHVNYIGAEKYTNFLANYIKQKYNLPDRKAEYSDWVDLLPTWHENVNIIKEKINKSVEEQT